MIFEGTRSGIFNYFRMDIDPCYKCIEKFRGGVHWYTMDTKDFVSSITFKLKNENNE